MRWAGHVARMGERKVAYRILMGKPEGESDHLEDPGVDERIILRWILWKWDGDVDWIDLAQEKIGSGSCKRGNKPLVSTKYRKFFD